MDHDTTPPTLYGHSVTAMQMLEGQRWEFSIRQQLVGSRWVFSCGGEFRYYASEDADIRHDLVPLYGSFHRRSTGYVIHAERQVEDSSVHAWLDAEIGEGNGDWQAIATLGVAEGNKRKVSRISMRLSENKVQPVTVNGVALPSKYLVNFTAKTSAGHFGPLIGYVRFCAPSPQDKNPFRVTVETHLKGVGGALFWQSFYEHSSEFSDSAEVRCTVRAGEEITNLRTSVPRLVDSFVVPDPSNALINFGVPVVIGSGEFEFELKDDRITGRIRLSGAAFIIESKNYDATVEGQVIIDDEEERPTPRVSLIEAGHESSGWTHDLTGLWNSEAVGAFELISNGKQTYYGTYQQHSGTNGTVEGEVDDFGRVTLLFSSAAGVWAFTKVQHEKATLVGQIVLETGEQSLFVASRAII